MDVLDHKGTPNVSQQGQLAGIQVRVVVLVGDAPSDGTSVNESPRMKPQRNQLDCSCAPLEFQAELAPLLHDTVQEGLAQAAKNAGTTMVIAKRADTNPLIPTNRISIHLMVLNHVKRGEKHPRLDKDQRSPLRQVDPQVQQTHGDCSRTL